MYKTGAIKVKTQILETIFAELPPTAKKVKLSIKFDDEEKFNTFKRLEAERQEDEQENVSIESESESEDEDALNADDNSKDNADLTSKLGAKKQIVDKLRHQKIDISLEEGIIYKQFYEKDFQKAGDSFGVKIKIRAQKITFQGYDIEDIEEAMDEAKTLMDRIQVEYIPKYGLQMSQSRMITKQLQKIGIKIFRILDKYYRWYEMNPSLTSQQQRQKKNDIKYVLRQIDDGHHCLQYLSSIQKDVDRYKGSLNSEFEKLRHKYMLYRPLLEELKGEIFEKQFRAKMNEEATEEKLEVELGISRDALVFHSEAKQLLEMSIKDAKLLFQSYDYFFLTIDSDHPIQQAIRTLNSYNYDTVMQRSRAKPMPGEIQQVKEINFIHFTTNYEKVKTSIQNKLNDPAYCGDYIPKESVVFCIGYVKKLQEKKLEYMCEMLEKLTNVWGGASYKISILLDQAEQVEGSGFSYEFNQNQKVFSLTANQTSVETNLLILRDYVIRRKIEAKRMQQVNLDPEENNISLSVVNTSQIINEKSSMMKLQNDNSISQEINTQAILDSLGNNNNNFLSSLNDQAKQQDYKCLKLLQEYKMFIPQTNKEYNEKYKDTNVKENAIVRVDKRNRAIEDDLTKISELNFQVFKVQLNPKHKIQSFYQDPTKEEVVTVFLSSKVSPFIKPKEIGLKIEQGMYDSFVVKFLNTSKESISENGYLLNIKKRNILVDGKSFKVKYGEEFEVAKELVYLKK